MLKIDDFSKKMPNLDIFVKKRLIRVSLLKSKDECRKNISADHVTRGSFTGSVRTLSPEKASNQIAIPDRYDNWTKIN